MTMMMRRSDQYKPENAEPCMQYGSEKGSQTLFKSQKKHNKNTSNTLQKPAANAQARPDSFAS